MIKVKIKIKERKINFNQFSNIRHIEEFFILKEKFCVKIAGV